MEITAAAVKGAVRSLCTGWAAWLCLCALACAASGPAASTDQQIESVFTELRMLRPMAAGRSYTVSVDGKDETGPKERFLRRRTAQEVSASGMTCGCGDYARVFIARIVPLGYDALLVDGAEISTESLMNHFSGHSVVAIRPRGGPAGAPWWLVDSTNCRLIDRNWSPDRKSFTAFDTVFWIGYCGPLEGYPVRNADELRTFYERTLASVPNEFLDRNLCQLDFTIDPSLRDKDGNLLNPRLAEFVHLQSAFLEAGGVHPLRRVPVLLVRGDDGYSTDLHYSDGGWVSHLGLKSGCSPSLLSYFEETVRKRFGPVFY
jgi:hypothetical protein